ncbi:PhoX family protein [Thiomicrorhabdus indica]|uniref:PhoX family protein n=1 Tax=Thiomicrorhabdus indica TaxID=2267253 RepID=UPI002AA8A766|nr:alkaline phosphatase PhoX [Thiomicrorhabdus indica]
MKLNKLTLALASVMTSSALVLSGCMSDDDDTNSPTAQNNAIEFKELSAPATLAQKNTILATDEATINGNAQAISYNTLLRTGDSDNGEVFGLSKNYLDQNIVEADGSAYVCNGTDDGAGSGMDHVSILEKGDKLYMVSQFECATGSIYMNELQQSAGGALSVVPGTLQFVSQKDGFGGWVHCAGMTTPWQSHLGSEEYEPDAKDPSDNGYFQDVTENYWSGDASKNHPYYYGWTPEVDIDASGNPVYTKHYSMGRLAHELAYVMPDERTVYLTDDGTDVGLFMFVADTAKDLSTGTLYAAKWNQTENNTKGRGGEADLTWINMGHASNADIKALIDPDNNVQTADGINFSNIFATEDEVDGTCPSADFTFIDTANGNECVKLLDVNGDSSVDANDIALASRLETRRTAAMLGATTEFRKEEGVSFNARDNKLYIAMSEVRKGMTDGKGHIDLTNENKCGAVYQSDVTGSVADTDGTVINSEFVATNMHGLVAGSPLAEADASGNNCSLDSIANPDNVAFIEGSDILLIGEDTTINTNDFLWAYDTKKDTLTRISSTPFGSENTSPYWYDINNFGYITMVNQHPYKESSGSVGYERPFGAQISSEVGYVGPFDTSNYK